MLLNGSDKSAALALRAIAQHAMPKAIIHIS